MAKAASQVLHHLLVVITRNSISVEVSSSCDHIYVKYELTSYDIFQVEFSLDLGVFNAYAHFLL